MLQSIDRKGGGKSNARRFLEHMGPSTPPSTVHALDSCPSNLRLEAEGEHISYNRP